MSEHWSKILIAVVTALATAVSTYGVSSYAKGRDDARRQRTEAYLAYLKARQGGDLAERIYTRDVVLAFGSAEVIQSIAAAHRAFAITLAGDKRDEYIQKSQDRGSIDSWVQMTQRIRNEFIPDDPVSDRDVLTLMCPDPTDTCYRMWYSKHLFADE